MKRQGKPCKHPEILIFTEIEEGKKDKVSAWCPTCHKDLKLKRNSRRVRERV